MIKSYYSKNLKEPNKKPLLGSLILLIKILMMSISLLALNVEQKTKPNPGINNANGNDCFMIASLQILTNFTILDNIFKRPDLYCQDSIPGQFIEFQNELRKSEVPINAKNLRSYITTNTPERAIKKMSNGQHDAQEFLSYFLTTLYGETIFIKTIREMLFNQNNIQKIDTYVFQEFVRSFEENLVNNVNTISQKEDIEKKIKNAYQDLTNNPTLITKDYFDEIRQSIANLQFESMSNLIQETRNAKVKYEEEILELNKKLSEILPADSDKNKKKAFFEKEISSKKNDLKILTDKTFEESFCNSLRGEDFDTMDLFYQQKGPIYNNLQTKYLEIAKTLISNENNIELKNKFLDALIKINIKILPDNYQNEFIELTKRIDFNKMHQLLKDFKDSQIKESIQDLFETQVVQEFLFTNCVGHNYKSETIDRSWALSLPMPEQLTIIPLSTLLKNYLTKENIPDFKCSVCGKQGVNKQPLIKKAPNIIIISPKRFGKNIFQKTNTPCSFDLKWNIENVGTYNLMGVILHGGGTSGGHYTAMIQDTTDKKWYYYNDGSRNTCEKIDLNNFLSTITKKITTNAANQSILDDYIDKLATLFSDKSKHEIENMISTHRIIYLQKTENINIQSSEEISKTQSDTSLDDDGKKSKIDSINSKKKIELDNAKKDFESKCLDSLQKLFPIAPDFVEAISKLGNEPSCGYFSESPFTPYIFLYIKDKIEVDPSLTPKDPLTIKLVALQKSLQKLQKKLRLLKNKLEELKKNL